jgi:proteasome alpha subunit
MIEEPYRWVEAIATRRDYIEMQLATGSPVVAVGYAEGILLFTVGQQKLFEIYDRIALGAIGHPGDIERLRMAAIELASTEGFTRSAADVSLRRLAYYSLSPVMKNAFEQIYGAPFLARLEPLRPTISFWKSNTTAPFIFARPTKATGPLPFWPQRKNRPSE